LDFGVDFGPIFYAFQAVIIGTDSFQGGLNLDPSKYAYALNHN